MYVVLSNVSGRALVMYMLFFLFFFVLSLSWLFGSLSFSGFVEFFMENQEKIHCETLYFVVYDMILL